jgi:LysR family transcriptional regulator (chromosome initiation inhibitor)
MSQLPVDQVRTLLTAVEEGTFEAAAVALHVTPSAVSQRVKALEQRIGRVLLLRTKPVRPTEDGRIVVRFARQLAQLERDARQQLGTDGSVDGTRLPVAVNSDSLATWFLPALTRVPPELRICFELHREDQDRTARLLREGLVMAAVTSSAQPVPGCSVRPLGRMRYLAVASPGFAARHLPATGRTPLRELLPLVPVVTFDRHDDLQDRFARSIGAESAGALRHRVPASEAFIEAVVAGLGWGMAARAQAEPRLSAGTLLALAPRHPIDVPLYWQQWKLGSPALEAAAEAVATAAAEALDDEARDEAPGHEALDDGGRRR